MKTTERTILYSLMALLVAANFSAIVDALSRPAHAAAALLERLGPVEAITLTGDDADKDVVLSNRKGRLAWAENEYGTVSSLGFIHIGRVLDKLMDAQELQDERQTLGDELNKQEEEFRARHDELVKRGETLAPDSPEFKAAGEEFQRLRGEIETWKAQALGRLNQLRARHIEKSYRELVNAVEIVGDRKGVDLVFRFIPTDEDFKTDDSGAALEGIRSRTVLKYPDGLDITADVLEELSLPLD